MSQLYKVSEVRWQSAAQTHLRAVRQAVFIDEQRVPVALEWDDDDLTAHHFLVKSGDGEAIACARVVSQMKIGRMAVLKSWRNKGIARVLMDAAIKYCQHNGAEVVRLSAQVHAVTFYTQFAFKVVSEPYFDAGILHVDMVRNI